jgi:iron complex outermembrane receptor protein
MPGHLARVALCTSVLVLGGTLVSAQTTEELKRMSLEEMMSVSVSTFSRVPEPSNRVPAAVFVLTGDDIRRSGATTLPEALRLVPGVQVARQDAARYAIGIRGFADRLSRAMLVLIDGRAVYSPLFAGTYWEVQDTFLPDIDRIEVIRGPGGSLWGANAVNGIINIITKKADATQGWAITAGGGNELWGPFGVRYGGAVSPNLHVRAYAKGFDRGAQFHADGSDFDKWHMAQGGFRADWSLARSRTFTLQGDLYSAELGQRYALISYTPPFSETLPRQSPLAGGNVLARWAGPLGSRGEFQLQTHFDRTTRDERPVAENRNTFDVDFQHRYQAWRGHDLVWGAGYRVSGDDITSVPPTAFLPDSRTDNLYTAFAQDELTVIPDRLLAVVGAKIEHNAYSGFEVQPSARILWTIVPSHSVVASVSRAVRTPSRVESDYTTTSLVNPALPSFVRLLPNPDFMSEELVAYELGYRVQPLPRLYTTVSGFFNSLDNVLSTELGTAFVEAVPTPPRLILPVIFKNGLHGHSHGAEVAADWRATDWLRTTGSYSYVNIQLTPDPGSTDVSQERRGEGLSPRHQGQIQASFDLPGRTEVDWMWRYVGSLPAGPVPAYATSDLRVGWNVAPGLELSLVGTNLHHAQRLEWPSGGANTEIERSGYIRVTWKR